MNNVTVTRDQRVLIDGREVGTVAMISVGKGYVYEAIAHTGERCRRTSPLNAAYALRDRLAERSR